jgi:hypothetical protein
MDSERTPTGEARDPMARLRGLITALECLRLDMIELQLRRSPPLVAARDVEIAEAVLLRAARR